MGWTFTNRPAWQSVKEFLAGRVNCENERRRWILLDCAIVQLRTAYMAVEIVDKTDRGELDHSTRKVVAFVYLLDYQPKDYHNTGYKDMDESMGPCQCDCPERILKLLTETKNEYAMSWREMCRRNIEERRRRIRPKTGDVVRSGQPIKYSDGVVRQRFQVLSARPAVAKCLDTGAHCKIRNFSGFIFESRQQEV